MKKKNGLPTKKEIEKEYKRRYELDRASMSGQMPDFYDGANWVNQIAAPIIERKEIALTASLKLIDELRNQIRKNNIEIEKLKEDVKFLDGHERA